MLKKGDIVLISQGQYKDQEGIVLNINKKNEVALVHIKGVTTWLSFEYLTKQYISWLETAKNEPLLQKILEIAESQAIPVETVCEDLKTFNRADILRHLITKPKYREEACKQLRQLGLVACLQKKGLDNNFPPQLKDIPEIIRINNNTPYYLHVTYEEANEKEGRLFIEATTGLVVCVWIDSLKNEGKCKIIPVQNPIRFPNETDLDKFHNQPISIEKLKNILENMFQSPITVKVGDCVILKEKGTRDISFALVTEIEPEERTVIVNILGTTRKYKTTPENITKINPYWQMIVDQTVSKEILLKAVVNIPPHIVVDYLESTRHISLLEKLIDVDEYDEYKECAIKAIKRIEKQKVASEKWQNQINHLPATLRMIQRVLDDFLPDYYYVHITSENKLFEIRSLYRTVLTVKINESHFQILNKQSDFYKKMAKALSWGEGEIKDFFLSADDFITCLKSALKT